MANGLSPKEAAKKAMTEVTGPVIAIVLVLCAVFVPVGFLGGITGQLYKQFAITIAVSVTISGFVALTLSPALCALVLKPGHETRRGFFGLFNRAFDWVQHHYASERGAHVETQGALARYLCDGDHRRGESVQDRADGLFAGRGSGLLHHRRAAPGRRVEEANGCRPGQGRAILSVDPGRLRDTDSLRPELRLQHPWNQYGDHVRAPQPLGRANGEGAARQEHHCGRISRIRQDSRGPRPCVQCPVDPRVGRHRRLLGPGAGSQRRGLQEVCSGGPGVRRQGQARPGDRSGQHELSRQRSPCPCQDQPGASQGAGRADFGSLRHAPGVLRQSLRQRLRQVRPGLSRADGGGAAVPIQSLRHQQDLCASADRTEWTRSDDDPARHGGEHHLQQRARSRDPLQRIQYRPRAGCCGARATVPARLSMPWSGPRRRC